MGFPGIFPDNDENATIAIHVRERIRPRGGKLLYPYKSVMTTFSFDQIRIVCLALMTASCQRGKWNEEKEEEKERKKYVDSMKFSRPIIIHVRREGSLTPFENRSRTLSLSLSLFPPTLNSVPRSDRKFALYRYTYVQNEKFFLFLQS